jgi:acetyl-CoA carboxylase biotin carboxyl carrier protein
MPLSSTEIREILNILGESGWEEAQVTVGDVTIAVSRGALNGGSALAPSPAPPTPAPAAAEPAAQATEMPAAPGAQAPPASSTSANGSGHVIAAPSVGVFWRSPEPGAAPFVEVGDEVEQGQTLCIVEVMKLMQHVTAELSGSISAIHSSNGDHVEFGTPLFSIAPAPA